MSEKKKTPGTTNPIAETKTDKDIEKQEIEDAKREIEETIIEVEAVLRANSLKVYEQYLIASGTVGRDFWLKVFEAEKKTALLSVGGEFGHNSV